MTYLLYLASVAMGLFKKRSRVATALILACAWALSAFAAENADSAIYQNRYEYYDAYTGMTEPGYRAVIVAFHRAGVSYQAYRCVVIFVALLIMTIAIRRLTDNVNFVLALYLVFPFCMDVVQMRFSQALCFAVLALSFLYDASCASTSASRVRAELVFLALILCASLFHSSVLAFLLLLFAERVGHGTRMLAMVLAVSLAVYAIGASGVLGPVADALGVGLKYGAMESEESSWSMRVLVRVCVGVVSWLFLYRLIGEQSWLDERRLAFGKLINVAMFALVPLFLVSVQFYRIQVALTVVNFALIAESLEPERRGILSVRNLGISVGCLIVALVNLYLLVLSSSNIDTVFFPLFESNTILSGS